MVYVTPGSLEEIFMHLLM
ncbi:rCG58685 [Rattus norvegicus]|uniref:RCG58685 n=1 Tax=Rattus norvegicus TaxID=10116 RepID=A6JL69_RAT|nr:rCG58685 [Rattus norvegicus]